MTWDLRMRVDLSGIINQIYGHTKWRAHVERPVALLPTEGHGIGPLVDQATSAAIARAARRDDRHTVLQVKMVFTWSSICVTAGTHSHGFWDLVPTNYADELDLNSKRPKNGLPKNGKDPLGIAALMVKYALPTGCVVIFDPSLWHTHGKLSAADAVVYVRYLGTTTCMEQVDDQMRSFREGNEPKTLPSGDPVHYVPLKYFNFPAHMWAKILMLFAVFRFQGPLRPGEERVELHPMVQRSKTGKKDLFIVALPNYGHVCPTLTRLGLRILVGEERMEQMRLSGEWDGGDTHVVDVRGACRRVRAGTVRADEEAPGERSGRRCVHADEEVSGQGGAALGGHAGQAASRRGRVGRGRRRPERGLEAQANHRAGQFGRGRARGRAQMTAARRQMPPTTTSFLLAMWSRRSRRSTSQEIRCAFLLNAEKNAAGPCLCRCLVSVRHAGVAGAARTAEKEAQEQQRLSPVRARGTRVADVVSCGSGAVFVVTVISSSHKIFLRPIYSQLRTTTIVSMDCVLLV